MSGFRRADSLKDEYDRLIHRKLPVTSVLIFAIRRRWPGSAGWVAALSLLHSSALPSVQILDQQEQGLAQSPSTSLTGLPTGGTARAIPSVHLEIGSQDVEDIGCAVGDGSIYNLLLPLGRSFATAELGQGLRHGLGVSG